MEDLLFILAGFAVIYLACSLFILYVIPVIVICLISLWGLVICNRVNERYAGALPCRRVFPLLSDHSSYFGGIPTTISPTRRPHRLVRSQRTLQKLVGASDCFAALASARLRFARNDGYS
jgi:hypothetical protein